jgi:hypothetical protein
MPEDEFSESNVRPRAGNGDGQMAFANRKLWMW